MKTLTDISEREQDWVIARLHVLRREAADRAWHARTHSNDYEQCKAEADALEAAIGLLEAT
jgi:hypothetical protein